jgi:hypothetical protein
MRRGLRGDYVVTHVTPTSTSKAMQILGSGFDTTQIHSISVDGVQIPVASTYKFSDKKSHKVKIVFRKKCIPG